MLKDAHVVCCEKGQVHGGGDNRYAPPASAVPGSDVHRRAQGECERGGHGFLITGVQAGDAHGGGVGRENWLRRCRRCG